MATRKRFIDDASASALVRYGPELDALKELMLSTGTAYRQKVHSAQAGAAGIQSAVASAVPQLQAIYGSNPVAGIPGLSRAQALGDMISRGVRASESAAGARRTALQELGADRAKIDLRRQGIAQEIGAFTSSEADKLSSAASDRALRNRISLRSSGATVKAAQIRADASKTAAQIRADAKGAPKGKAAAKAFENKYGVKPLSVEQHNALRSKVDSTAAIVKDQIAKGSGRHRIAGLLLNGRAAIKGAPTGGGPQISLPAIPKTDPFVASLALDLAFDNHISDRNAKEAHRRGYTVRGLGLPGHRSQAATLAQSLQRAIGL